MQCQKRKCNCDKSVDVVEEQSFLDWSVRVPEPFQEMSECLFEEKNFQIWRESVVKVVSLNSHENVLCQPSENEGTGHMQKRSDIQ